jgi:hypothetical protein
MCPVFVAACLELSAQATVTAMLGDCDVANDDDDEVDDKFLGFWLRDEVCADCSRCWRRLGTGWQVQLTWLFLMIQLQTGVYAGGRADHSGGVGGGSGLQWQCHHPAGVRHHLRQ